MRRHYIRGHVKKFAQLWFWLFFINILLFLSALYFYQRVTFWKSPQNSVFRFFLFHNNGARILLCLYSLLLMLSGDVEMNPRRLSNCKEYFSICQWNLSSISAHDYSKLFILKTYYTSKIWYYLFIKNISWFYYSQRWWQITTSWVHFDLFWPSI